MEEQEHSIETGHRVRLQAGGPVMQVLATSETMAYCSWTEDGGRLQQGTFDKRSLRRVEAGASDGTRSP